MYRFLAKQGQHTQIVALLEQQFQVKPQVTVYNGERGIGMMVECELPKNVSKRTVDRFLHSKQVAGAKSRRNVGKVVNFGQWVSAWHAMDSGITLLNQQVSDYFKAVYKGKFYKARIQSYSWCECCGPQYYVQLYRHGLPVN